MDLLITWLLLTFAVWITAALLPGIKVKSLVDAVVVAAIFGVLNWAIGWLLFILIGIGTLGLGFLFAFLTRWIVNALLLKLTDALTDRLSVASFGWAFVGALMMSALGTLGEYLVRA